ncbi:ABC transporter permease [candidate division KSB1 bacterium]|nr:ABC transporter permease [candidate division KSB1 bacterium]
MFKNYLKIAFRNMNRQKIITVINILSLALGLMCCILIAQYVISESGFDTYHRNGDRLFRVTTISEVISTGEKWKNAFSSLLWGPAMKKDYPEIENFTRIVKSWEPLPIEINDQRVQQDNIYYAENSLFDFFDWRLIAGDARTVFDHPYHIVLTETSARKYFGAENPLGKSLTLVIQQQNEQGQSYEQKIQATISGIMADVPFKTHLKPEVLISFITLNEFYGGDVTAGTHPDPHFWRWTTGYTYLRLPVGIAPESIAHKFPQFLDKYIGDANEKRGFRYHLYLQNVPGIHLEKDVYSTPEPGGNSTHLWLFSIIAFFVLLIACFNFINLATARAGHRATEVGIRKVVGSGRRDLIAQFLCEAGLISSIAAVLGFILAELIKPVFGYYTGKNISLLPHEMLPFAAGLIGVTLLVSILAGGYPAFFLSGFQPIAVLKKTFRSGSRGAATRQVLVILQFAITIIFIIATLTVYQQIRYMKTQDLGFKSSQILVIPPAAEILTLTEMDVFRNELLRNPRIRGCSLSSDVPGKIYNQDLWAEYGKPDRSIFPLYEIVTDYDFIDTYGLKLIAGRNFSPEMVTDARNNWSNIIPAARGLMSTTNEELDSPRKPLEIAVILNEAAVRRLGLNSPENALNKILVRDPVAIDFIGRVIGVVSDFHFHSLQNAIEPLVLYLQDPAAPTPMAVSLQMAEPNIAATIAFVEKAWRDHFPAAPFTYSFIDTDFEKLYTAEERIFEVFGYMTLFIIFIACLGLFGLILFLAAQKTKEIGIRKVVGATVPNIIVLLSKNLVKWILIANLIAWPIAWYALTEWLRNFASHITMSWWIFVSAGALALVIGILTMSYQAIKAALANPVHALKYE